MINMLVMPAVVGNPGERGVFKRRCAKNKRHQTHRPKRLKRHVRKQPMISERDAQAGRDHKKQKHRDLKRIHSVVPEIKRNGGAGDQKGTNQEGAVSPIDPGGRNTKRHIRRLTCHQFPHAPAEIR